MFINKKLAEEIAREMKSIIPFYFSIMDDEGTILTCTDASRNGTQHAGTFLMMDRNLDELIVERENQYEGCTMGAVFSIRFASKIIGFVGIQGVPAEIMDYGHIIQKMMELLVYEKFESFRQETEDNARELLVRQIIMGNSSETMFDTEKELIKNGMNPKERFTVAVLRYPSYFSLEPDKDWNEAKKKIARRYVVNFFLGRGALVSDSYDQCVVISTGGREYLLGMMRKLFQHVEMQYQLKAIVAISDETEDSRGIPMAFSQAAETMRFIQSIGIEGVHCYDPVRLGFLIGQIPETHIENLRKKIFCNCSEEEIYEFRNFILAYVNCNGSLKLLSEKYYLHKNTIQYKIKRVQKKTGKDIRLYKDLMILYMAAY